MNPSDPSFTVPQELMPHVHLVSSRRYPHIPHVGINEVAQWLLQAPLIARDKAPFCWQMLDKPADGTILMTWQPLQRLATNFATDGYVWAPPEQLYKHDLGNGLILEIYYLKAGYGPPQEQYTAHARRRFRLVPASGHPNAPQPDPNLFIVHWGPSDPNDTMPVTMVPWDQRTSATMQQRQHLLKAGQIRRKEFMLSDRANWPSLPELTGRPVDPQMAARGVPQHVAYPPTQAVAGPPAKRARHAPAASQHVVPSTAPVPTAVVAPPPLDPALDDDEDTSRGDMFDHLTPREISLARYQQNHEWMEEILSSPYRINQITPADLNLGLMGSLASLTEGIFAAQGADAYIRGPDESKAYVGRQDPAKADDFRKRVEEHIKAEKAQMEEMKKTYEAAIADMKTGSLLSTKEKELRLIQDSGSELWKPHGGGEIRDGGLKKTVDEIIQEIESSTGRRIEDKPSVKCVEKGGYTAPPAPSPSPPATSVAATATTQQQQQQQQQQQATDEMSRQPSQAGSQNSAALLGGESDVDMGGTAAGLLDQMGTGSAHSTPAQQSGGQSGTHTPQNAPSAGAASVPGATPAATVQPVPATAVAASSGEGDVTMGGTDTAPKDQQQQQITAPDQGTGSGDWVMVPKNTPSQEAGASTTTAPAPAPAPATAAATAAATPAAGTPAAAPASSAGDENTPKPAVAPATAPSAKASSAVGTPATGGFDQNDFSSLGDLDSAGDALAGYDAPALDGAAGELGEGLDLQMDMEDSAFGDAFHGVDSSETPGQDM